MPVRLQLARSLVEIDPPKGAALLREALVLALDVRTRAMVAVQFGMTCLHVQKSPEAVQVLSEVLDALDLGWAPIPDPADRELRTHAESALLLTGVDEKATIAPIRARVAKMTPPPGDTPAQRQLLGTMTVVTAMDGTSPALAVEQARRAMRAPGVTLGGWSLLSSALALSFADEVGDCMEALDRVLEHARENAAVRTYVLTLSFRAFIMHGLGELADAISDAQVSLDVSRAEPWGDAVTMPPTALAAGLIDRGEPARAEELLAGVVRTDLDRFVWEYHWFLMTRARARWSLGDADTALALFGECGDSLKEAGLVNPAFVPWWVESACVLADTRRPGDAVEIVDYGEELARRWGTPRVLGLAALARGVITPGTAGMELLAEAASLLARSPARLEQARAEFRLGQALLESGYSERARGHLRTAADLARRCGALALARSARRGLVAAGGRMREITESPVDMLTGTERKVAALAVAGSSNRVIAESLFVTVRTVESHLTNVYRKLGVGSRAELDTALADMPASIGGPAKRVLSERRPPRRAVRPRTRGRTQRADRGARRARPRNSFRGHDFRCSRARPAGPAALDRAAGHRAGRAGAVVAGGPGRARAALRGDRPAAHPAGARVARPAGRTGPAAGAGRTAAGRAHPADDGDRRGRAVARPGVIGLVAGAGAAAARHPDRHARQHRRALRRLHFGVEPGRRWPGQRDRDAARAAQCARGGRRGGAGLR